MLLMLGNADGAVIDVLNNETKCSR
jgi:hypothetical protein